MSAHQNLAGNFTCRARDHPNLFQTIELSILTKPSVQVSQPWPRPSIQVSQSWPRPSIQVSQPWPRPSTQVSQSWPAQSKSSYFCEIILDICHCEDNASFWRFNHLTIRPRSIILIDLRHSRSLLLVGVTIFKSSDVIKLLLWSRGISLQIIDDIANHWWYCKLLRWEQDITLLIRTRLALCWRLGPLLQTWKNQVFVILAVLRRSV